MTTRNRLLFCLLPVGCLACLGSLLALGLLLLPAQVRVERDVRYGEAGGEPLLLDIYHPPEKPQQERTAPARPAIIFIHGGGWSAGDKQDFADMANGLAQQGYVGFSVNYRLARPDGNHYPAQLDDVQRAVRWMRAHARQYRLDPARLCAVGGSAGGHLAALLGTAETRDNFDAALSAYSSRVTCVVDFYGPADLLLDFPTQPADVQGMLYTLFGQTPAQAPDLYRQASPLYRIDGQTVPFLIIHGTLDPLVPVDQSQRFYAALKAAGVEAELLVFENEGHGLEHDENGAQAIESILAFLERHLQAP